MFPGGKYPHGPVVDTNPIQNTGVTGKIGCYVDGVVVKWGASTRVKKYREKK